MNVYNFFKSKKLTIVLIFTIIGFSLLGTIITKDAPKAAIVLFDPSTWLSLKTSRFYKSVPFIFIIFIFTVNLCVCVYDHLKKNWKRQTNRKQLGIYITHLSIVFVIIASAISALFGFTGTVGIFEGREDKKYYNWSREKYMELPFSIRVEKVTNIYYPPLIEIELDEDTNKKKYSLGKGSEFYSGNDKIVFSEYLPDAMAMNNEVYSVSDSLHNPAVLFKIYRDNNFVSNYWIFKNNAGYINGIELPYNIKILSDQYLLKNAESLLSIIDNGEIKIKDVIRPNKSISYKGISIYYWGINQDQYRNYYTGLQISYDPGLWFMWIALGGVLTGLFIIYFIPDDII